VTALRPRERRLLVLAALVGLAVAGYVYVVEPLFAAHAATQELVAARTSLLARQRRLIARTERNARELETLRRDIEGRRGRLLPGDKPPLAASELQRLVKATAQDTGIEVRSERILPTVDRGGYAEVPIEVTLAGPIRALTAFLYRLEGASILLTLKDLKVRAPTTGAVRDLAATLSLSGYIATGAAPAAEPVGTAPARPPTPARPGA
jgi:type II secretory pathway component PulM